LKARLGLKIKPFKLRCFNLHGQITIGKVPRACEVKEAIEGQKK